MDTKLTTFDVDFVLWKAFQKKLIDNISVEEKKIRGSKAISMLIADFLAGKIDVNYLTSEKPLENKYTAGLHIDEKVWLDLDIFLAKKKAECIGDKEKQKYLNKGKIIIKLIRHYVNK